MITIQLGDLRDAQIKNLLGSADQNLEAIRDNAGVDLFYRDGVIYLNEPVTEEQKQAVADAVRQMLSWDRDKKLITPTDINYFFRMQKQEKAVDYDSLQSCVVGRTLSGKTVKPKTLGQLAFVKAIHDNSIVFAVGPAGTGKTYLAVISAVMALKNNEVKRIVLTRPAVEAGESLGFLPGDLREKVDPYLTPLYDALYEMLGKETVEHLIEKGTVEIAPLAYMRGRTLNDAFVILDEAQNTTGSQMKMFLTRLGFHSKMVITGDVTQIDLSFPNRSGLIEAEGILQDIPGIAVLRLNADDVVRHPLVQKIIERYEEQDKQKSR